MEDYSQSSKVKIEKIKIAGIELQREYINNLSIYESICQPAITGNISLNDFQGLKELKEVFIGDDLEISFLTENRQPLNLKFKIFSSEANEVLKGRLFHSSKFGFCSPWMIDGMTKRYSKNYENKFIHEIIEDLLKHCGAKVGFIEPTMQLFETFVCPLWTPIHTIKHLLNYAKNKSEQGGYVIFTDLKSDKVNVMTIESMLNNKIGTYDKEFDMYPGNAAYEGSTPQITFETDFDIIRHLNVGMGKYIVQGFDFDRNDFYSIEDNIQKYDHSHLTNKFPIESKYLSTEYALTNFNPIFSTFADGTIEDKVLKDLLDGYQRTRYSHLFSDMFKINIFSNASTSRRCGMIASIKYPSINENVKGNNNQNKHFKGNALIRDIHHIIANEQYSHVISLALDGYHEFSDARPSAWK